MAIKPRDVVDQAIRKCPWCHNTKGLTVMVTMLDGLYGFVHCSGCKCWGPKAGPAPSTEQGLVMAVHAWNTSPERAHEKARRNQAVVSVPD